LQTSQLVRVEIHEASRKLPRAADAEHGHDVAGRELAVYAHQPRRQEALPMMS
jgi:hypothetical protein